ncbi:MAG: hypothetical protein ABI605_19590 [Rhizobacter sp.]
MKADPKARQGLHSVSVQADFANAKSSAESACRNQNRMHVQKALMEFLLLGRIG